MICPLISIFSPKPRECLAEDCAWFDAWVHVVEDGVDREGCCSIRYLSFLEEGVAVEFEGE